MGKLRGNRDGPLPAGLTVQDRGLKALQTQGGRKIGQADGLGPDPGLIEIPDRGLDEKDLHGWGYGSPHPILFKSWVAAVSMGSHTGLTGGA